MSAVEHPEIVITADGQSDAYNLGQSYYKVFVKYGSGVTGTLTPRTGMREDDMIDFLLPDDAATLTASGVFLVAGPGLVAFNVADLAGGQIKVEFGELLP